MKKGNKMKKKIILLSILTLMNHHSYITSSDDVYTAVGTFDAYDLENLRKKELIDKNNKINKKMKKALIDNHKKNNKGNFTLNSNLSTAEIQQLYERMQWKEKYPHGGFPKYKELSIKPNNIFIKIVNQ